MCGIAGILRVTPPGEPPGKPHRPIPEPWLDALDHAVAWRGRDDQGRFRDTMTRPDGTTVEVALVHRRLAIIDPDTGRQPMTMRLSQCPACADKLRERAPKPSKGPNDQPPVPSPQTPDPLLAIVFNGCIFNHRELRAELEAKGHVFSTDHSDTEVLLHARMEWPEDYAHIADEWDGTSLAEPDRIEGMYAFALWDGARGTLELASDRFAEKPLAQARLDKERTLIFGSSAAGVRDAVRLVGPHKPTGLWADEQAIVDFVSLGFCTGRSAWSGISFPRDRRWIGDFFDERVHWPRHKRIVNTVFGAAAAFFAASMAVAACAGFVYLANILLTFLVSTGLIWIIVKLPVPWLIGRGLKSARTRKAPTAPVEQEIEELLEISVARRLDADVPLGCFLSGGVDSSLVALMARRHREDLTTLTLRMPDDRYDESEFAEETARFLGTRHIAVDCDPTSAAEDLIALIRAMGLPFADSSILPTWWLCRGARGHIKVALAGDGGDELFFGYDRYKASRYLWWPKRWLVAMHPMGRLDRSDPKSLDERKARLITAARHAGYLDLLAIFPTPDRRILFAGTRGRIAGRVRIGASASDMRGFDLYNYLPDDLLRKVDTASMLAGVEVRCPFLAPDLADAALRIPARTHTKGGEAKHILRRIAREHLPPGIVDRPKRGFAVPLSDWLRSDFGGLGSLMMDRLTPERPFGPLHDTLSINVAFIRRMIDEHRAAGGQTPLFTTAAVTPRDHAQRLFALTTLAIWCETLG